MCSSTLAPTHCCSNSECSVAWTHAESFSQDGTVIPIKNPKGFSDQIEWHTLERDHIRFRLTFRFLTHCCFRIHYRMRMRLFRFHFRIRDCFRFPPCSRCRIRLCLRFYFRIFSAFMLVSCSCSHSVQENKKYCEESCFLAFFWLAVVGFDAHRRKPSLPLPGPPHPAQNPRFSPEISKRPENTQNNSKTSAEIFLIRNNF